GEKREQQRSLADAGGERDPEQPAQGGRQLSPERRQLHGQDDRERRGRREQPGADQRRRMGSAADADEDRERQRNHLREAERNQTGTRRTAGPFGGPGPQRQRDSERSFGPRDLEIERPRRIEGDTEALPVGRPFHATAVRARDHIAGAEPAGARARAGVYTVDRYRAAFEPRHEPE